jgi:hypothetical protein
VLLPVLLMVLEAPGSMLGIEGRTGAKRIPDIRIGPDGEESFFVVRAKKPQRQSGGLEVVRVWHDGNWVSSSY